MKTRSVHGLLLVCLALVLVAAKRQPGLGDVADVRTWSYPTYTRVVVETTRSSRGALRHLGANRKAGLPERLYVDLPGIWVGADVEPIRVKDGLARGCSTRSEHTQHHPPGRRSGALRADIDLFFLGFTPSAGAGCLRVSGEIRAEAPAPTQPRSAGAQPGGQGAAVWMRRRLRA